MNSFNTVFSAVKKRCCTAGINEDVNYFEHLAGETNMPVRRLHFYLHALQDLGLITYSDTGRFIQITASGRQRQEAFDVRSFPDRVL